MKRPTYRCEDDKHTQLQHKLLDDNMTYQDFADMCVDQYLEGKITKESVNMKKSYYCSGKNGSYFEFELENGDTGLVDTVSNIIELPSYMGNMTIDSIIKKYGEGEIMNEPENPEMTHEKCLKYV